MLLNIIFNFKNINFKDSRKKIYNIYIKNKYTRIFKFKKIYQTIY